MADRYESEAEIEQVVRGFETCATPAADFHHREHLTVAVWYLETGSREQTVERMRTGLLRFLGHHGVDAGKYSEDVTLFWVDAIASRLAEIDPQAKVLEKCNQVIDVLASSTTRTPAARVEAEGWLAKS